MGKITGIHHVALKCDTPESFKKTVDFYTNVLGLKIAREWAAGIQLDTGAGLIEIFNSGDDILPQGVIRHFAIGTDDTDSVVEAVRKAGYKITTEPKDVVIASEIPYPIRIAFFIGPMGEEVEVFQEK